MTYHTYHTSRMFGEASGPGLAVMGKVPISGTIQFEFTNVHHSKHGKFRGRFGRIRKKNF